MAGTSPPPRPNRLRKQPPGGKYDDHTVLAKALLDEQLRDSRRRDGSSRDRNHLSKPPPGAKYDDANGLAQTLIDESLRESSSEQLKESSRRRNLWNALKALFRRSDTGESSSAEQGNGEPNPRVGEEQAQRDAPRSQQQKPPSEALRALQGRSPEGVREVATAMWKLIDNNPKYQQAYLEKRLPLAEQLKGLADRPSSKSQRPPEMSMTPFAERAVPTPSAAQRFSREAQASDSTTKSQTSDKDSLSDTSSLSDAAESRPLLDPSSIKFLDQLTRFQQRSEQMRQSREQNSPSPDPSSSVSEPGRQNPVADHIAILPPDITLGSQHGGQDKAPYVMPAVQTPPRQPGGRGRGGGK
ncbi:hypothetical protein ACIPC1_36765 [Streptomyces sp. NPDC087263]|uniref:hypothetical protein n=1 Tax=Streptomyces sp. NPDC087263 TaxID=3365773 RepID=UPI003826B9DE